MDLQYVLSEKNQNMLVYNRFLHIQEKVHVEKTYWKCTKSKNFKCKGCIHIVNQEVVKFTYHNNHVPNMAKIEVKKAISSF